MSSPATTLICTVGTSLFQGNLARLESEAAPDLHAAYAARDWGGVAQALTGQAPAARLCGAEINSVESILEHGYTVKVPRVYFLHSDTEDGHGTAAVLKSYYTLRGFEAHTECVEDLQDEDPARFATRGLRTLARRVCAIVRNYSAATCAINATGGYKAQIAIAVLLGQALAVPVYYKHERFDTVIPFPPMPIALDFDLWMGSSALLFTLAKHPPEMVSADEAPWPDDVPRDRLEALIQVEDIDGARFLELTATGQVFHEAFNERFRAQGEQLLPAAVPTSEKRAPKWEASGHMRQHGEVMRLMERMTAEIPQVAHCRTHYYNPDLPARTGARLGARGIEVVYSNGAWTTKIAVESLAQTRTQSLAMVARLNRWLTETG